MESRFGLKPGHVVADAGYDSEENLDWLKKNGCKSVIKRSQYEISKKKQYKERFWLPAEKVAEMAKTALKRSWNTISMRDEFKTIYGDNVKREDR